MNDCVGGTQPSESWAWLFFTVVAGLNLGRARESLEEMTL